MKHDCSITYSQGHSITGISTRPGNSALACSHWAGAPADGGGSIPGGG
jgi:hypothetical protein